MMPAQTIDIENRETGPQWAKRMLEGPVPASFNEQNTMMFFGCEHDIGHPVAITPAYLANRNLDEPAFMHGCCGCCQDGS